MTTRQSPFLKNNNINKNTNKTIRNNKIVVNKSSREFPTKTEREASSSNLNNIINISSKNSEENIPYIPVNQRRKLTVNKKLIDSFKANHIPKTNSLNFNENEIPRKENIKKNEKEKLYLSNIKQKSKKIFGEIKTNTEEKNRYWKKCINENYTKENYYSTNKNKENLDIIRYNKAINSNRKNKDLKNDLDNKKFNNLSHTIDISNNYNHLKRRNKIEIEYVKTNKEIFKNEKS